MVGPDQRGGEPDAWAVLGIQPGASAAELKRAFRQQARRWHPDLNPDDPTAEERFKSINAAYAVLSDPSRQRAWRQGAGSDASGEDLSGFPSFEDYLAHLFGRKQPVDRVSTPPPPGWSPAPAPEPPVAPPRPQSGGQPGHETVLALTPEQAWTGSQHLVALPDGTHVEVQTPPGAGDGWRLRLAGAAADGSDHLLRLYVRTQEGLRLEGLHVHYRLDVFPTDAVLGGQVTVPSLHGPVELEIPPKCSSGQLLRLRRCGFCPEDDCGDQIVELRIVVPSALPDEAVKLYRQLQDLEASY